MKKFRVFYLTALLAVMMLPGACNKQPKCGCDGDIRFTLHEQRVTLTYDKDSKFTQFVSYAPYSIFTPCDIEAQWDNIKKFSSGEEVLISGDVFDDCMKQMSPYAYNSYEIRLTGIKRPPFKKK